MNKFLTKRQLRILAVIVVLLLLIGCVSLVLNSKSDNLSEKNQIATSQDLNKPDMVIAGQTEILATREAKKHLTKAKFLEFAAPADCYVALSTGKVDAVVYDRPALEYAVSEHKDLVVLSDNIEMGHISVAAPLGREELLSKVNEFIRLYRKDGTYKAMYARWVYDRNATMPDVPEPKNPSGTIVIGVDTVNVPMSFIKNGEHTGFDIEFAKRLALYLNKKIEFKVISYEALIPALQAGKIDLAIDQIDATPERKSSVLFSDEYIDSPIALMIRKSDYASGSTIASFSDLEGKTIGCLTGSIFDELVKKYIPQAKVKSFSQVNTQIVAIEDDKLDATMIDTPLAICILAERPDLTRLSQTIPVEDYAWGFNKNNSKLEEEFSGEIARMKKSGELKKLQDKWLTEDKTDQSMPEASKTGKDLTMGVFVESQPFAFVKDNKIAGYEAELAILIANKLGYKIKLLSMDFSALIACLDSGKVDIIGGSITATQERRKSVLFSDSVYDGSVSIIVKKNVAAKNVGFIQSVKDFLQDLCEGFTKTFIVENRWQLILQGLCVTVIITFFSVILGTILAFPVCMLTRSKNKFISLLGEKYISIIQGTPILVILMIMYYVIFAKVDINAIFVAIFAFALDFAAYTGVMLRSGIDGIPRGQTEASLALGFTPIQTFFNFILPQAVRSVLPVYRSEIISTLKSTSVVGYIAIMDLTKMSDIIRSRTYDAFFPLISTAIIYFIIAKCLISLLIFIENKVDPEYRRNQMLKRGAK